VAVSGNDNSGDVLAQILAIYLIRYGSYAVYPRTKSLEQVQTEWDNQLRGDTADKNIVRIGAGENPLFALSCVARRLGDQTMFNASIINLKSGAQDTGASVNYKTINDGMEAMQTLVSKLSYRNDTEWRVDSAENFKRAVEIINNNTNAGNYTIILTGNITLSSWVSFDKSTEKTVTITGDSQMRTINGNIVVSEGIHLVLGNNVTLDGNGKALHLFGIVTILKGSLTLQEGAVLRNGGNCGVSNSGTFTMNGGTISGNKGGGVRNTGGTFTMNGGTISGNTFVSDGGGVYNTGTFTMTGGTISGNKSELGGGVCILAGTFIKTGGTIDATNKAKTGKVAYAVSVDGKRDRTAGPKDNLDSSKSGRAGGWE